MQRNKAEIITGEQKETVSMIVESFTHDLVPKFLVEHDDFTMLEDFSRAESGEVTLHWKWRSRAIAKDKTFLREPCIKTEEDFFNEIRAYLFSLCLTLVNL